MVMDCKMVYDKTPFRLAQRPYMSLAQIVARDGVTIRGMEASITDRMRMFIPPERGGPYIGWSPALDQRKDDFIDSLYNLYVLPRNAGHPMWLSKFDSLDSFGSHFFPTGFTHMAKMDFREVLSGYLRSYVHPLRIINEGLMTLSHGNCPSEEGVVSMYMAEGTWQQTRYETGNRLEFLVEQAVIDEAQDIRASGYVFPDLFHNTSSASMAGIEAERALRGVRSLLLSGTKIGSGAFTVEEPEGDYDRSASRSSVYASNHPSMTSYGPLGWFNEHPIAFGINEERQTAFLKANYEGVRDAEIITDCEVGSRAFTLGPEVPFSSVDALFCAKIYKTDFEIWAERNFPGVPVVSLEAMEVLDEKWFVKPQYTSTVPYGSGRIRAFGSYTW